MFIAHSYSFTTFRGLLFPKHTWKHNSSSLNVLKLASDNIINFNSQTHYEDRTDELNLFDMLKSLLL